MKHSILKPYIVLFSLVTLFSACAGSGENTSTSNSNSSQQANSNSQPAVAQGSTPASSPDAGTPLSVQPIPAPAAPPTSPTPAPAVKPPAAINSNTAKPATAAGAPAPKLVAPAKKLEFGKQPQDKTLIRAITIRNGGRANLNIESVTPS